ncbi:Putative EamA domain, nucleotide-sugar transporter [Septoria linicola]|uniref:EamA domain, nucleotide-sugar transporter n=1 Tax=Septoria linicola TaxID=215465 RepID=A0A9Q9AEV0_9PEZI|nr:Putative EamA domain, nucleotide-sugar transporter [Septoria linicola]
MSSRPFIPALVALMLASGAANTILTKYQDMQCVADCDSRRPRMFEQPVLQTLQMFVGESGCWLVVFLSYLMRRLRRPSSTTPIDEIAYEPVHTADDDFEHEEEVSPDLSSSQTLVDPTNIIVKPAYETAERDRIPLTGWKILMLAAPAICDICGTTLMNVGLLFVAASIYQMTRGALVLFVGLFSVLFLKRQLGGWKWTSLFIVVLGVAVVGLAGVLDQKQAVPSLPGHTNPDDGLDLLHKTTLAVRGAISTLEEHTAAETLLGFFLIACAQIFTAAQFTIEERIMERYIMDPIRVVGWEGVFGFLVTLIGMGVLHATIGTTEAGRGGYFDAREGFYQMFHHRAIGLTSILIMISIGGFNFFGLSVTRYLSATSRSTIDTCRTLFIWIISLGLGWETFKWLQVVGFALLVYGTALFNEIVQPPTIEFLRRKRSVALRE